MKSSRGCVCLVALFFLSMFLGFFPGEASASVDVGINVNIGPPPIVMAEPPAVIAVPNSRVYFVPEPGIDIFFYAGFWWSPRGDRWYQSRHYNQGWVAVEPGSVPVSLIYMPRDYRVMYGRERHIPYGQWKKDYPHWDKERMKAHKQWEKEREKEWKRLGKHDRYDRHGYDSRKDHRGGPPSGPARRDSGPHNRRDDRHGSGPGPGGHRGGPPGSSPRSGPAR